MDLIFAWENGYTYNEGIEMTTYLATNHRGKRNEVTYAYCSKMCRYRHTSGSPRIPRKNMEWRDDTSYEFNETCLNCGALIPADWSKGEATHE